MDKKQQSRRASLTKSSAAEYLTFDRTVIRTGAICLVNTSLLAVPTPYFSGYLFFVDMKGKGATPNHAERKNRLLRRVRECCMLSAFRFKDMIS